VLVHLGNSVLEFVDLVVEVIAREIVHVEVDDALAKDVDSGLPDELDEMECLASPELHPATFHVNLRVAEINIEVKEVSCELAVIVFLQAQSCYASRIHQFKFHAA